MVAKNEFDTSRGDFDFYNFSDICQIIGKRSATEDLTLKYQLQIPPCIHFLHTINVISGVPKFIRWPNTP